MTLPADKPPPSATNRLIQRQVDPLPRPAKGRAEQALAAVLRQLPQPTGR